MPNRINNFFKNYLLLIIVFITGAAVLVIEVAATRILSVYFGNTIFTVSSVISVILLALSLGYFVGGRLADKRASEYLFFQLIALSGLSVFLLQLLNSILIPSISGMFSLQYGPMVTSLFLFLFPGFLLGMLSPLVATLQKVRLKTQGIGQITGDVFFWSTLGSIVGSVATGFYLIPTFGVSQIILGVGMTLVAIGLWGMITSGKLIGSRKKILIFFIGVSLIQILFVVILDTLKQKDVVYASDGVYDNILIFDHAYEGKPTRFLQQATDASSAMYLDSPELVYDYTKYYSVYKLVSLDIKNALVIGGGAYSVPKALLTADPDVVVDVAEIEPDLFTVGKKYFRVPDDQRLVNHVEDGRRFLQDTDKKYDVLFIDAFHFSIPAHLTTKEFFALSREKLSTEGMCIVNIIGSLSNEKPSFLLSEIKTFKSVYPNSYFFALSSPTKTYPQNIIMVGYNSEKKLDLSSLQTDDMFLASIPEHLIRVEDYLLEEHPVFTDDYAPAEYFIIHDRLLKK